MAEKNIATEANEPPRETDVYEIYVAENAASLQTVLIINEKRVKIKFANKVLRLHKENDAHIIKAFDELMQIRPALAMQVRKLDVATAEEMAKQHMRQMQQMHGGATGTMNTSQANLAAKTALNKQEEELRRQGADPEKLQQMMRQIGEDNVTVTEKGTPPHPGEMAGFIPETKPTNAPQVEETVTPKNIFANLGK